MERECKTLEAMIRLFCRRHHGKAAGPCPECNGLLSYARERLEKCPFGNGKPSCANCPVHCYKPAMRERIRAVMRHAGPRMIWSHPVLAAFHLLDGWRKAPTAPAPKGRGGK
jgi:ATP-dependent helicase YprA (DUF1998 family)